MHQQLATSKELLSVVIPSRNNADLLLEHLGWNYGILKSESTAIGLSIEMILVLEDTGDCSARIAKDIVGVDLVILSASAGSGYGGKCNLGASNARGNYLLILTTDIQIQPSFLAPLIKSLEKSSAFSTSPRILRPLESFNNESITSGKFRRHQIEVVRKHRQEVIDDEKTCRAILWPCGATFLTKKERFVHIGGFADEYLPGYSEDVDLGIRAWNNSWSCVYVPYSTVYHWHNSTFKRDGSEFLNFLLVRNHILLNLKFLPWSEKFAFLVKRLIKTLKVSHRSELKSVLAAVKIWWSARKRLGHYTLDRRSLIRLLSKSY